VFLNIKSITGTQSYPYLQLTQLISCIAKVERCCLLRRKKVSLNDFSYAFRDQSAHQGQSHDDFSTTETTTASTTILTTSTENTIHSTTTTRQPGRITRECSDIILPQTLTIVIICNTIIRPSVCHFKYAYIYSGFVLISENGVVINWILNIT
jgi:hypothetical protein